jgi:hypothetical protein
LCKAGRGVILDISQGQTGVRYNLFSGDVLVVFFVLKGYKKQLDAMVIFRNR